MKMLTAALLLGVTCTLPVQAQAPAELFVTLNSGVPQTQGMALVLASQALEQKAAVHLLLCSEGGHLAIKGTETVALKPRGVTPENMLRGLIKAGARIEVCALFLPNSDWKATDLIEGVTVAKPADVTAHLLRPNVRTLSF